MLGLALRLTLVMLNPSAEAECRAFPVDYDIAECDGLDADLDAHGITDGFDRRWMVPPMIGTYDQAMGYAHTCETPTSWVEMSKGGFWFAVCGTDDGRACGRDVPWTHYDCQESTHHSDAPNPCDQD